MSANDHDPSVQAVVKFSSLMTKFAPDYRSIEVRLIAAKQKRRSYVLLAGEAILSVEEPGLRRAPRFESDSVIDQHYWLPIKDLNRLEGCLSHKVVLGANPPVKIATGAIRTDAAMTPPQISFQPLQTKYNAHNDVVDRRFVLTWMGGKPSAIFGPDRAEALEKDLPGGYSRLREFAGAVIPGGEAARDQSVCFELAVPMLIRSSFIKTGDESCIEIDVEGTIDRKQVQVFIRHLAMGHAHRQLVGDPIPVRLEDLKWQQAETRMRAGLTHKLPCDLGAELQVKYRGEEWIEHLRDREADANFQRAMSGRSGQKTSSIRAEVLGDLSLNETTVASKNREVFLVHGRNKEAVEQMTVFLNSLDLKIIEWPQAVSLTGKRNPYIGEVVDAAMERAQAIIVLLTGDDDAVLRDGLRDMNDGPSISEPKAQPRMNVIFEAGLALGRYRENTLLVQIGQVTILSDILGQHIPRATGEVEWRKDVVERLKKAGCAIDDTGERWLKAGNFASVAAPRSARARRRSKASGRAKTPRRRAAATLAISVPREGFLELHYDETQKIYVLWIPVLVHNKSGSDTISIEEVIFKGSISLGTGSRRMVSLDRHALYIEAVRPMPRGQVLNTATDTPCPLEPKESKRFRVAIELPEKELTESGELHGAISVDGILDIEDTLGRHFKSHIEVSTKA
ncbi:MAG: nucleotide-binding protein [Planctomycetes bacterium]|nr:nucleotide-binding protein [Planctomycetota bacterium]